MRDEINIDAKPSDKCPIEAMPRAVQFSPVVTNVGDLLHQFLTARGFDGLVSPDGECACELADLIPCNEDCSSCRPAYHSPCPGEDGGCEYGEDEPHFHMDTEKPGEVKS